MKIFTIILNYNNYEKTKKCLDHLLMSNIKTKIIFIDNGSTDDSSYKLYQEFKHSNADIEFIFNEKNLGFAKGVNVGIKKVLELGGDYVLLLNNDAYILPDTIEKLLKSLQENPKAVVAGPTIFYYHNKNKVWQAGGFFNWVKMGPSIMFKNKEIHIEKLTNKIYKVDFLTACIWLAKTEIFKKIGLFYDNFFLYYDDFDFCFRVKKAGFELLYVADAIAYHDIGNIEKTRTSKTALYNLSRSFFIFIKKNLPMPVIVYGVLIFLFIYTPFRIFQIIKGKQNLSNIVYWLKGGIDGLFSTI